MHPSKQFQMSGEDAISFAAITRLGHLTTIVEGRIESVVVPFVVDATGTEPVVLGHVSVNNRQRLSIDDGSDALLIVDGPVAYVSPGLYPSKAESGRVVPTLNYVSVHVRGTLERVDEPDEFRALLGALTHRFEAGRIEPWAIDDAPDEFITTQMRAIVGFRLLVTEVQGVAKLSQNRSATDHDAVRSAFAEGGPTEREIARRMG